VPRIGRHPANDEPPVCHGSGSAVTMKTTIDKAG
jgi:hypothetical protein